MLKITFLVASILIFTSSNIFAMDGNKYLDGNILLSQCKIALEDKDPTLENLSDWASGMMCTAYLRGINDLNSLHQEANLKTYFCLPDGMKHNQSIRVVVKFLEDHPEILHAPAMALIVGAYAKAFPCK